MTKYYGLQSNFVCNKEDTLSKILTLIKLNKGYPLVVIDNDGTLFGIISNGDISSFINSNNHIDTDRVFAKDVSNQNPKVANFLDKYEIIERYLSNNFIRTIPIIDFNRVVKKIATAEAPYLQIGSHKVGPGFQPFLIAEIGVNHNGEIKEAKYLIENAAKSGCKAVKFQHRSEDLYNTNDINTYDLGTQYIISEIKRTNLSIKDLKECANFAVENNLEVIITPFDEKALEEIIKERIKISALKIASCDLTNSPLIRACCNYQFPLIISTGMSFEREIVETSLLLRSLMVEHAFLHCNSTYPAPAEDINLSYIKKLREITKTVVGYSSHDGNAIIPISSIGYGANIIEFHITRSVELIGTDHRASIEVKDLNYLVSGCELAYKIEGQPNPRTPSQGEIANRFTLGKSFALKKEYKTGMAIKKEDLILISPGHGFTLERESEIIGKKFISNKAAMSIINPQEIEMDLSFNQNKLNASIRNLTLNGYIPGIPVRYHDAKRLKEIFDIPLLEFHMSDRDLNLNPKEYLDNSFNKVNLIVHGVEQFEDGFIFDLCSPEKEIVQRSLNEIHKLVNHINKIRVFFKPAKRIPIVINLGGFTTNQFSNKADYLKKLDTGLDNLNRIINIYDSVEFLPQTMPPFPWHKGGRSFHNLLTNKEKLIDFINRTDSRICFDVSHSHMSCEYFGEELLDHIDILSSRIKHLHISDAASANSEGLEIGEGSIKFMSLHKKIIANNSNVYMIPEIWQGHLNNGGKFANSIIRYSNIISEKS